MSITASGRCSGVALASRYSHIVAAEAVMHRWRVASLPLALALALTIAIVGNVRLFDNAGQRRAADFQRDFRKSFFLVPRLPIASAVPGGLHPEIGLAPWVTLGWMRDGVASGRIPSPGAVDPVTIASSELHLALGLNIRPIRECEHVSTPAIIRLAAGSSIQMSGPLSILYTDAVGRC